MKSWSDQGDALHDNVDRKRKIIVGNITGDVLRPLSQLVIEKMDVNTGYSIMYNIGTDEQSSRVQKYQIGLYLNWYRGNPKISNYWNLSPHSLSNILF